MVMSQFLTYTQKNNVFQNAEITKRNTKKKAPYSLKIQPGRVYWTKSQNIYVLEEDEYVNPWTRPRSKRKKNSYSNGDLVFVHMGGKRENHIYTKKDSGSKCNAETGKCQILMQNWLQETDIGDGMTFCKMCEEGFIPAKIAGPPTTKGFTTSMYPFVAR